MHYEMQAAKVPSRTNQQHQLKALTPLLVPSLFGRCDSWMAASPMDKFRHHGKNAVRGGLVATS